MKKDNVIKIIFVIIMIAAIIFAAKYISNLNTTSLEEHEFYQYFGGRKVEYTGSLEISKENNGITNLQMEDVKIELDSTPIYYKDIENKMLLPQDMAIVFPLDKGTMKRVNHFWTVQLESNIPYLQYEKSKQLVENAFLFDGKDLYIFLEPTTLIVGEERYELSPLSYAKVSYRQSVEIYQKQEDTYTTIEDANYGNVTAQTEDYEINLSTDSLKYQEKEQLLLKKIDVLPVLEFEN